MISDIVLVALIGGTAPTLVALAGLVVSLRNNKKIEAVHLATNSMKDALVTTTRSDALQEGRTAGVAQEKADAALVAKGASKP